MRHLRAVALAGRLAIALVTAPVLAGGPDGQWELSITGHTTYLFGEDGFGGGVRIPWEVIVRFRVDDGAFRVGSGSARWFDRVEPVSVPADWFQCGVVDGTYLDSNLELHHTPRIRFSAFPVAGDLADGSLVLQPGYRAPGNYLAVTYECATDNPRADSWFGVAERGKQVMGKRQDAEKQRQGDRQHVRVREVASLPPQARIELPLRDGWSFTRGGPATADLVRYRLQRVD